MVRGWSVPIPRAGPCRPRRPAGRPRRTTVEGRPRRPRSSQTCRRPPTWSRVPGRSWMPTGDGPVSRVPTSPRIPGCGCGTRVSTPWCGPPSGTGNGRSPSSTTALSGQDAEGFVPHLGYFDGSTDDAALWGRAGWSSITQPPVYGWTVAELVRRGVRLPDELVGRARAGLAFLLRRRRRSPAGLIEIVHPWESGCDHSPRWDDLMAPERVGQPDPYDERKWFDRKGALVAGIERSAGGAPLANPDFPVGSVAFSAIVAWCAAELADVIGDGPLRSAAEDLSAAVGERWDPTRRTYVDDGPTARRLRAGPYRRGAATAPGRGPPGGHRLGARRVGRPSGPRRSVRSGRCRSS